MALEAPQQTAVVEVAQVQSLLGLALPCLFPMFCKYKLDLLVGQ
jgi:hypothetical protein